MAFWVAFDHLGKLLIVNFLCALLVLTPLALAHAAFMTGGPASLLYAGLPLVLVALCGSLPLAQAGMVALIKELIDRRDGELRLFFTGIRVYAGRLAGLNALYVLGGVCLVSSVFFYGYRIGPASPLLGYGLSALALWALFFLVLSALFAAPALIYRNTGSLGAFKLAALLVLDNPLFSFGLLWQMLVVAGLALMPPVLLFFSFAPMAVLQCSAYEILSRKYKALESLPPGAPRGDVQIDFGDEDDEYLCRGFRDLLFPWKG